jgi:hypothetical protein
MGIFNSGTPDAQLLIHTFNAGWIPDGFNGSAPD